MWRLWLAGPAFSAGIIVCALGQDTAIRVNARLVEVNVIVHDRSDRPVADLQKENFKIFDRGKPQNIAYFSIFSKPQVGIAAAPRPSSVYSNRGGDERGFPPTVTIILLDRLNTHLDEQAHARQGVIDFLGQMSPEDPVALYTLDGDVRVLHDFTSSPERLLQVAAKYRRWFSAELDNSETSIAEPTGDDDFDAFVQGVHNQFADFQNRDRALRTLAGLEAIANHVAGLPGRKNLVWLSGGFPFTLGVDPISDIFRERRTFFEEAQRAARAVSDAGVAIYPIDVRTRLTPVAVQDALRSSASPNAIRRGRPMTPLDQNLDTLEHLADQTGGRAFINTNNFRAAITQAVQDALVTYTLGFYPDGEPDGKFHELKVSVDRHGLKVRHRKGYLALADMPPSPAAWKAEVEHARVSPIPSQQIGIEVQVQPNAAKASSYRLLARLDARDLLLERKQEGWTGNFEIEVAQLRPDDTLATASTSPLTVSLPDDKYREVMEQGLRLTLSIDPEPGVDQVQVLALDEARERIGSVRVLLKASK